MDELHWLMVSTAIVPRPYDPDPHYTSQAMVHHTHMPVATKTD